MDNKQQVDEDNLEVGNVENFRSDKNQMFSHQSLVMSALQKCLESGSHEMRSGWWNEKRDMNGNVIKAYNEDTRKKYVESVKTAIGVMACDFDEEAKEIEDLIEQIKDEKNKLLKEQNEWYNNLEPHQKDTVKQQYGYIIPKFFNTNLGWWEAFCEFELNTYRDIFIELNKLSKRLDYYQSEDFEG